MVRAARCVGGGEAAVFVWIGKAVVRDGLCRSGSVLSCAVCSDNGPRQLACVFGFGRAALDCGLLGLGAWSVRIKKKRK